jgi:hypothetical protein
MDFVHILEQAGPEGTPATIHRGMAAVVESPGYVSAAQMNVAIAGACLIGAMAGARGAVRSPFVRDWLTVAAFDPPPEFRSLAHAVFERAFQPEDNEWFRLWEADGALERVRRGLEPFDQALALV